MDGNGKLVIMASTQYLWLMGVHIMIYNDIYIYNIYNIYILYIIYIYLHCQLLSSLRLTDNWILNG